MDELWTRLLVGIALLLVVAPGAVAETPVDDFSSDTLGGYSEHQLTGAKLVSFAYDPDAGWLEVTADDQLSRNVLLGVAVLDDALANGVLCAARYRQDRSGLRHVDWKSYLLVDGELVDHHQELDIDDADDGHPNSCDIGPKVVSYHRCTCDWVTVPIGSALPSPGRIAWVAGGNDGDSLTLLVHADASYLDFEKLLGDFFPLGGAVGEGFVGALDDLRLSTEEAFQVAPPSAFGGR